MPKVSIVMLAYNASEYIAEALQSILDQTFIDFELIVVDDGSTDTTWEIISAYSDRRIIRIKREHDYITSLNCAMQMARGIYIARMDADDMMHPERLAIQVAKMDTCPEIDICSTWMYGLYPEGDGKPMMLEMGTLPNTLIKLLRCNFIYHPTIMLRRSFWQKHKLCYRANYRYAEDYKLWSECATLGATFHTLPQILHYYRARDKQVTVSQREEQRKISENIQFEIMSLIASQSKHKTLSTAFFKILENFKNEQILSHEECVEVATHIASKLQ